LGEARLASAIADATSPDKKSATIAEIARVVLMRHGGSLPCDRAAIEALPGIGPKCAALALGIACGIPALPVDVHVHRIANRWGAVATSTPERTMLALEAIVPPGRWLEVNRLLVPFGKDLCTRERPRCPVCPVAAICARSGVPNPR
ncbi:MAG: endonuclease III domain-containing protein, partial [Chloroflexota bacterium]